MDEIKKKKSYNILYIKNFFCLFLFIIYITIGKYYIKNKNNQYKINNIYKSNSNIFINYINDCKSLKKYNKKLESKNLITFISVCISLYNSEKFIEKAILSIINQSFQNFEIIVINDYSLDNTLYILTKLQKEDNRIKIINHSKNLGTYHSRVEGPLNSKGKYILYLDPDDMILNPNLFKILYQISLHYFDIIEYTVYYQIENNNKIYFPKGHTLNHNHNYKDNIIHQPELSNIIYYKPQTKKYSDIICRTIWNKLYNKNIVLKAINYIGMDYYQKYYIIVVEDTLLNIIFFHYARNYTNAKIPGYLYNIRKSSITRLKKYKNYMIKKSISFFLYYKLFYKYIKEFGKDRNYLFYDLKKYGKIILIIKKYKVKNFVKIARNMFNEILNDNKASIEFKKYIKIH